MLFEDDIFDASAFDREGWFVVASWEVYFDESTGSKSDVVVTGGAYGDREHWKLVREYCREGRSRFSIPYLHTGKLRQLSRPYSAWKSDADGGEDRKRKCFRYFCGYPRGITPVAASLSKIEFDSTFPDNAWRGRVGNCFAVCGLAAFGFIEALAEKQGIAEVYYFMEQGPGVPHVSKVLLNYGRKVTAVTKLNEPLTDVADAVSYEYWHLRDDEQHGVSRKRTPLDLLIADTEYKFIEIKKGALVNLQKSARIWGKRLVRNAVRSS